MRHFMTTNSALDVGLGLHVVSKTPIFIFVLTLILCRPIFANVATYATKNSKCAEKGR